MKKLGFILQYNVKYRHSVNKPLPAQFSRIPNIIKMKAVTLILLVVCAMSVYGDLVCGTNYCKQHPCSATVPPGSCKKPSEYRTKHAGKCGCCPACVTLLSEGSACKTYSKELGETPSAVCRDPLKCLSGVCTKIKA